MARLVGARTTQCDIVRLAEDERREFIVTIKTSSLLFVYGSLLGGSFNPSSINFNSPRINAIITFASPKPFSLAV